MGEWVAFEVLGLFCGILPGNAAIVAIGANAIIMNLSGLVFMLYFGTSIAAKVRIGNALGAGQHHRAEVATYLALLLALGMSLVSIIALLGFGQGLCSLFTDDAQLVDTARSVLWVVALYQLPDAIQVIGQGVLQASGRHRLGAKLNFVAYYVVALPVAYALGIKLGYGVTGFWIGMTVGLSLVATAVTIIVVKSNWRQLSFQAKQRLSITGALGP